MEKNVLMGVMLDLYGAFLTDRQRELMELHYNQDYSLSEIAEHAGISRQGVHDALRRGEQTVLDMEAKLHLAERDLRLRELLEASIRQIESTDIVAAKESIYKAKGILED